jgi:hypothetical protein
VLRPAHCSQRSKHVCLCAGKDTVNTLYGTRVAVLVGDFLFAQSSWYLANLDNLEVIKLISQVGIGEPLRDKEYMVTRKWSM